MTNANEAVFKTDHAGGFLTAFVIVMAAVTATGFVVSDSSFLAGVLFISTAVVAVFRFEWFVYAQVFLLPWYPFLDSDLPVHDISLALRFVLLAGVWIVRMQRGKSVKDWLVGGWAKKSVLLFASVATVSLFASTLGPNINAVRYWTRLLSYIAVFFAILGWVETRRQLENLAKAIILSGIAVALFGFYQLLANNYTDLYFYLYPSQEEALEDWSGRITSLLFHFNSLAGYLNLTIPLALTACVLAKERWLRAAAFICCSASLAALYFTGSRGGLIACVLALLLGLFFLKPIRLSLLRLGQAMLLAALIVFSLRLAAPPDVASQARLQEIDDFTAASRLALWGAAGAMFLQNPVLGVGYGNYRALYTDYVPGFSPDKLDSHNLYLQLLSETGALGFLAFVVVVVILAKTAIRVARHPDRIYSLAGIAMGGALAATLSHGMVDYLFGVSPQFGVLFWLVMALGLKAAEQTQNPIDDHARTHA